MYTPSTPVFATTLLAAAGSFSVAQAQQEFRGTRLPNASVIRVLPSTTTSARPQAASANTAHARTPSALRQHAGRSGISTPMVSPGVVSSNSQERIAAARQRSNPRGSVAAAHPSRRIVITSANSSPVLRDPASANQPQRVPNPVTALARETITIPGGERGGVAPRPGAGNGRTGGPSTPTPRSATPDAAPAYGPQSMHEPASRDQTAQSSSERRSERLASGPRTVTRLHAMASPGEASQIRVERTQVSSSGSVALAR